MSIPPRAFPVLSAVAITLVFGLYGSLASAQDQAEQLDRSWRDAAAMLVDEANAEFRQLAAEESNSSREVRFGEAITLLGVNPKTEAQIDQAAAMLGKLAEAEPADQFSIPALYYQARIEQLHRFQPDIDAAMKFYEEVRRRDPAHPLADLSLVKLAIIQLAAETDEELVRKRVPEFQALRKTLASPPARRDLNLILAEVNESRLGDKEAALENILEAQRSGIARNAMQATAFVRTAELASAVGRTDLARDYYEKFIANFPREARLKLVKDRLAELTITPTL